MASRKHEDASGAGLIGGEKAAKVTVGTFHSFALKLLRENCKLIGFPRGIAIADAADQLAACKTVLRELHVSDSAIQPAVLQSRISLLKSKLVTPEEYLKQKGDEQDDLVARAYERYEEFLSRIRAAAPGPVESGEFGAMMDVELVNDGPVTLVLER